MQRIAFTIIYNGDHHLKHNNYSSFIPQNFDHWVIIEGASLPTGSTSWCKNIFTESGSEDNTINSIQELTQEYKNITYREKRQYGRDEFYRWIETIGFKIYGDNKGKSIKGIQSRDNVENNPDHFMDDDDIIQNFINPLDNGVNV